MLLSNVLPAYPNDVHTEVLVPGAVSRSLNPPGSAASLGLVCFVVDFPDKLAIL